MTTHSALYREHALPRKLESRASMAKGLRVLLMAMLLCWLAGLAIGAVRHDVRQQIARACRQAYSRGLHDGKAEGMQLEAALAPSNCVRWGAWGPKKAVICQEPRHASP